MAELGNDMDVVHFSSYSEAEAFITQIEKETFSCFTKFHLRNHGIYKLSSLDGHRIWWEDFRGTIKVPYEGVPFVSVGTEVRECHQGHKVEEKHKTSDTDHMYVSSRKRVQTSKKVGCTANIHMKMIVLFPEYKIDGNGSEWKKRMTASKLKESFNPSTLQIYRVYVRVNGNHHGHLVGELSGYGLPLHGSVRAEIDQLVEKGIKSCEEISHHFDKGVSPKNRRFHPTKKDIQNHVLLSVKRRLFSEDDQVNLMAQVNDWREKFNGDNIFYRPLNDDTDKFLFVYQSSFQKNLLRRYGKEMVVVDSTYKTCKYELPLFLVCISTNVGYSPVSCFIVQRETIHAISEAFSIIKQWNPDWRPDSFMCDFDRAEIAALENEFRGADVYVCDFHREQAWQRWFSKPEYENLKGTILKNLRKIAHAENVEECEQQIENLKNSEVYTSHKTISQYLENQWLQGKKRWVNCFRSDTVNVQVSTTNGVEALNKKLKYCYLKTLNVGKTISGLTKVLIEIFFPDSQNLYIQNNVVCMPTFKRYSKDVPDFLVGRPKKFVLHCLKRITPNAIDMDSIQYKDSMYSVKSSSGQEYDVCFTSKIPSCSCPDWKKFKWPCKHMLAIFCNDPNAWNSLSDFYRNLPWFNIDMSVIDPEVCNVDSIQDDEVNVVEDNFENKNVCGKTTRNECLSILKTIGSSLYCTSDVNILNKVRELLKETDVMLDQHLPKVGGLPLRSTFKRKKKITRCSKAKKRKGLEVDKSTCLPQTIKWSYNRDLEDRLKNIWSLTEDNLDQEIGKIGPYTMYQSSFNYMKTTLTDEVMDAFLHRLVERHPNVLHINSITLTAIMNGHVNIHACLKQIPILQYEYVVGAFNERGSHWTLVIFKPIPREIVYCNPLGTSALRRQRILMSWYNFLKSRVTEGLSSVDQLDGWVVTSPNDISKQIDGQSCGIYVLKYAENYLAGLSLDFNWNAEDLLCARKTLALYLLQEIDNSSQIVELHTCSEIDDDDNGDDACIINVEENNAADKHIVQKNSFQCQPLKKMEVHLFCICKKEDDGRLYWQCKNCEGWFHPRCLGRDDVKFSPEPFYCDACLDVLVEDWDVKDFFGAVEDDDENEYAISSQSALSKMKMAYKICLKVVTTRVSSSNMEWIKHHLDFIKKIRPLSLGFGFGVFSTKALMNIENNLTKHFFQRDSPFSIRGTITQVCNEMLKKEMEANRYLSYEYIRVVLMKESLITIMQEIYRTSYKKSLKYLQETVAKTNALSVERSIHLRAGIKEDLMKNV